MNGQDVRQFLVALSRVSDPTQLDEIAAELSVLSEQLANIRYESDHEQRSPLSDEQRTILKKMEVIVEAVWDYTSTKYSMATAATWQIDHERALQSHIRAGGAE